MRKLLAVAFTLVTVSAINGCATQSFENAPKASSKSDRADEADKIFRLLDANGDGFITRDEMKSGMTYAINYEPNPNLMLGLEAGKKKAKKPAKRMTASEIKKVVDDSFIHDTNLDNRLSEQEFKKLVVERAPDQADPFASIL